jgi:hypothetical protein
MVGNQLFQKIPPIDYINKLLQIVGIIDFDENYYFSKYDMSKKDAVKIITDNVPTLSKYYLKCKANKYLKDITYKKIITIYRQILRPHKYRIVGFEKYTNGEKYLLYKLEKDIKIEPKEYGLIMNFD